MIKVLIGVPTRDHGGTPFFWECLGRQPRSWDGVEVLDPFIATSGVIPGARNRICRKAIEVGADYVWMLDDDQPFDPNDLRKLLAHNVDVVLPLSLRRVKPYAPLIYRHDELDAKGGSYQYFLNHAESGLIKIAGGGMAGCLIKRHVLEAIGDPWFRFERSAYHPDDYAEDYPFYRAVREAGFGIFCDLDVRFGHQVTAYVWPVKQGGKWVTALADDQPFAFLPQLESPLATV